MTSTGFNPGCRQLQQLPAELLVMVAQELQRSSSSATTDTQAQNGPACGDYKSLAASCTSICEAMSTSVEHVRVPSAYVPDRTWRRFPRCTRLILDLTSEAAASSSSSSSLAVALLHTILHAPDRLQRLELLLRKPLHLAAPLAAQLRSALLGSLFRSSLRHLGLDLQLACRPGETNQGWALLTGLPALQTACVASLTIPSAGPACPVASLTVTRGLHLEQRSSAAGGLVALLPALQHLVAGRLNTSVHQLANALRGHQHLRSFRHMAPGSSSGEQQGQQEGSSGMCHTAQLQLLQALHHQDQKQQHEQEQQEQQEQHQRHQQHQQHQHWLGQQDHYQQQQDQHRVQQDQQQAGTASEDASEEGEAWPWPCFSSMPQLVSVRLERLLELQQHSCTALMRDLAHCASLQDFQLWNWNRVCMDMPSAVGVLRGGACRERLRTLVLRDPGLSLAQVAEQDEGCLNEEVLDLAGAVQLLESLPGLTAASMVVRAQGDIGMDDGDDDGGRGRSLVELVGSNAVVAQLCELLMGQGWPEVNEEEVEVFAEDLVECAAGHGGEVVGEDEVRRAVRMRWQLAAWAEQSGRGGRRRVVQLGQCRLDLVLLPGDL